MEYVPQSVIVPLYAKLRLKLEGRLAFNKDKQAMQKVTKHFTETGCKEHICDEPSHIESVITAEAKVEMPTRLITDQDWLRYNHPAITLIVPSLII